MRELFNGKDAYVIINYSNRTHLIRHNVTRAFEDDYKNGKLETKQITIFDEKPHHFYVDNYDGMSNFKYFDVYEHTTMWYETHGRSGAPTDLRTLLDDAQAIKNMYGYLYIQMYSLKEKLEEE